MADEELTTEQSKTPATPEVREFAASRDSDENIALWANGIRQRKDPVLKGNGGDLAFYDQVRMDGQVWATLQQRRDAVVALPWTVKPGAEDAASEEAAAQLKAELELLDMDQITRQMHWGLFYGYAVGECMWATEGGRFSLADIRVRRARRFGFDIDGQLMLRQVIGRAEEMMPAAKFWVMSTGADSSEEPYGLGLAHLCYWPAYFKRAGLKSWMLALEKYASPTTAGKYPSGTSADDINKLLSALLAAKTDSAIVFPDDMDVSYLQTGKATSPDYETFDKRMDAWISKVVLSQTMTTDDGSSNSQSSTHMEVRDEVTKSDADLICGSFNRGPAQWWSEWNFGDRATPPQLVRVAEDSEDLKEAAGRDERLFRIGYRPTLERITSTYGEGYEAVAPTAPPVAPTDLAEGEAPPPDAISEFVDQLVESGAAPQAAADILAPVTDAVRSAESLEDMRAALGAITFSDDQIEPLREHLARAAFAARLGGEVGADLIEGVSLEEV